MLKWMWKKALGPSELRIWDAISAAGLIIGSQQIVHGLAYLPSARCISTQLF